MSNFFKCHSLAFYKGYTYPWFLRNRLTRWFWKKWFCKHNQHLFDEVLSGGSPWRHYLYCDACGLELELADIPVHHLEQLINDLNLITDDPMDGRQDDIQELLNVIESIKNRNKKVWDSTGLK